MKSPGRVMKVSLPQLRMYPVLKWGRPAATVNPELPEEEARGGRDADLTTAPCWMDPNARSLTKVGPFLTHGDMRSLQAKHNDIILVDTRQMGAISHQALCKTAV